MGNSHTFHLSATRISSFKHSGANVVHVSPAVAQKKQIVDSEHAQCHTGSHPHQKNGSKKQVGPTYKTQVKSTTSLSLQKARRKIKKVFLKNEVNQCNSSSRKRGNVRPISISQKNRDVSKISKNAAKKKQQKASNTDHCVLRLAFSLFSKGKATITIEDLDSFFSQYTDDDLPYEEIREMVHRACNGYEIDFACFQRIVCMDENENSRRTSEAVPFASDLPGQVNIDYAPVEKHMHSESLGHESGGCTQNRRELLQAQKNQLGVYNPKYSRSFNARNASISVKQSHLDLIMNHGMTIDETSTKDAHPSPLLKRCISQNPHLTSTEEKFFQLRDAFKLFDMCQYGSVDSHDLSRVMKELGLTMKKREVRQLFSLVGKKKKADRELDFQDFVTLYRKCSLSS